MELSWRDKYNFFLAEFKRKLYKIYRRIPHKRIIGGFAAAWLMFVIALLLYSPSSVTSHVPFIASTSTSSTNSPSTQSPDTTQSSGQPNPNPTGASSSDEVPLTLQQASSSGGIPATQNTTKTTSSKGTKNSSGGSSNTTSSSSNSNSSTPPSSRVTDLSNAETLYFYDDNGNLVPYIPPDTPPIDVTWTTYLNVQDDYSIDYPVGWQVIKTNYNGHEGISLYPPGMSTTLTVEDGLKQIGFGVSNYEYQLPYFDPSQQAYTASVLVDGYAGTLYTQGQSGTNTIAVIFNYGPVYFGMGSTANSDDIIYVFQHMLTTLQLGI